MNVFVLCLLTCVAAQPADHAGTISGIAVNGTREGKPLANVQVVLRASHDGEFQTIAETTTDQDGRFAFTGLPIDAHLIYLPGVNHHDVHYPGQRIQLRYDRPQSQTTLTAFDAIESPSPLISQRHEINLRPTAEFMEVEETVVVENASLTTFVGKSSDEQPVTLVLTLPDGIDKITFEREFHGRNFQVVAGKLSTGIPFRPGTQELKFTYRLAAEQSRVWVRKFDRPTGKAIIRVIARRTNHVACNLPGRSDAVAGEVTFEYADSANPLPAGYLVEVQMRALPIGFATYARWGASGILCVLIAGSLAWRRQSPARETQPSVITFSSPTQ